MIKKNTRAIYITDNYEHEEELECGMPLSKGEILTIHKKLKKQ